jgi:hypothetical protein
MKNAYQRRRVKARVEKRARMMKLDAITLDFARQVIEEETGTPLEIGTAPARNGAAGPAADGTGKLIARDEKKNPLISAFEWSNDAAQRILRVPAGFMRNKTQERIEALARERAVTAIDLALVEDGIEIGKKMMAEMIASYPAANGAKPAAGVEAKQPQLIADAQSKAHVVPAVGNGSGYLNEVSTLNVPHKPGDDTRH